MVTLSYAASAVLMATSLGSVTATYFDLVAWETTVLALRLFFYVLVGATAGASSVRESPEKTTSSSVCQTLGATVAVSAVPSVTT